MAFDVEGLYWWHSFGYLTWDRLLATAIAFGWKPEGAIPIAIEEQIEMNLDMSSDQGLAKLADERGRGGYGPDSIVTRNDAVELGRALKKALASADQKIAQDRIDFPPYEKSEDPFWQGSDKLSIKTVFDLANLAESGPLRIRN